MTFISRTTTIREWGHLSIGKDGVSPEGAGRLHKLAERETRRLGTSQPILARTARPSLQAGQVVGVLTTPGASVEILPKIGEEEDNSVRAALARMLAVTWGLPVADSDPALLDTQRVDILEVLVRLFADRLLAAVRRGLPHRYRPREDDLLLLRGKLDIRRQFSRHIVRADRLACRFDELSVDTPFNRVLKAAVRQLVPLTRSAGNQRKLAELSARFEFVGDSSDPLRERVFLDRTNGAFHRLHGLACRFLAGDWQNTTSGSQQGFALLFPMNELFEEFVGRRMRVALAPRSVHLQHTGEHALDRPQGPLFALNPDIVVDGDIIIDTKWKKLEPDEPKAGVNQSDVYQMLAYARAYKARRLLLLYPWHAGIERPGIYRRWRIAGTETPFDIATVDVGKPNSVPDVLHSIVGE